MDDYRLDLEDYDEEVPLYTEAHTSSSPNDISSDYTNVDLFNRVTKLYFNDQVQSLPLTWGIHSQISMTRYRSLVAIDLPSIPLP